MLVLLDYAQADSLVIQSAVLLTARLIYLKETFEIYRKINQSELKIVFECTSSSSR